MRVAGEHTCAVCDPVVRVTEYGGPRDAFVRRVYVRALGGGWLVTTLAWARGQIARVETRVSA